MYGDCVFFEFQSIFKSFDWLILTRIIVIANIIWWAVSFWGLAVLCEKILDLKQRWCSVRRTILLQCFTNLYLSTRIRNTLNNQFYLRISYEFCAIHFLFYVKLVRHMKKLNIALWFSVVHLSDLALDNVHLHLECLFITVILKIVTDII